MVGGHSVHEWQAILLTTVVTSIHFNCTENEKELTPRGGHGNNPVMQVSH